MFYFLVYTPLSLPFNLQVLGWKFLTSILYIPTDFSAFCCCYFQRIFRTKTIRVVARALVENAHVFDSCVVENWWKNENRHFCFVVFFYTNHHIIDALHYSFRLAFSWIALYTRSFCCRKILNLIRGKIVWCRCGENFIILYFV